MSQSEIRRLRLEMMDHEEAMRPRDQTIAPEWFLGTVAGSPGTTVPAYFKVQPQSISGTPAEGGSATFANRPSGPVLVYVLGPNAPTLGQQIACWRAGGGWVGETCCTGATPCLLACSPCPIPLGDFKLSWTNTLAGNGSLTLFEEDAVIGPLFWESLCTPMAVPCIDATPCPLPMSDLRLTWINHLRGTNSTTLFFDGTKWVSRCIAGIVYTLSLGGASLTFKAEAYAGVAGDCSGELLETDAWTNGVDGTGLSLISENCAPFELDLTVIPAHSTFLWALGFSSFTIKGPGCDFFVRFRFGCQSGQVTFVADYHQTADCSDYMDDAQTPIMADTYAAGPTPGNLSLTSQECLPFETDLVVPAAGTNFLYAAGYRTLKIQGPPIAPGECCAVFETSGCKHYEDEQTGFFPGSSLAVPGPTLTIYDALDGTLLASGYYDRFGTLNHITLHWSGGSRSKPEPTAQATVEVTVGASSLLPGTYRVAYTFFDGVGETTIGTSESDPFVVPNFGFGATVTLPVLPVGVLSINVYLTGDTGVPGTEMQYATGVTTTTFVIAPFPPGNGSSPPASNSTGAMVYYVSNPVNDRLSVVQGYTSLRCGSRVGLPEWPPVTVFFHCLQGCGVPLPEALHVSTSDGRHATLAWGPATEHDFPFVGGTWTNNAIGSELVFFGLSQSADIVYSPYDLPTNIVLTCFPAFSLSGTFVGDPTIGLPDFDFVITE